MLGMNIIKEMKVLIDSLSSLTPIYGDIILFKGASSIALIWFFR